MGVPTVRIQTFPNDEVRVVHYFAHPKSLDAIFSDEKNSEPLLDITSKLKTAQNEPKNGCDRGSKGGCDRPGYGGQSNVSGFTLYGRRQLLRAGGALDKSVDSPEDVIFLTGTLPGSTYAAKKAIANWSAYAVQLVQWWLGKRSSSKLAIYCWEFQKRGALHLHYAIACPDKTAAEYIVSNWKAQWTRVIDAIGKKSGVDMWRKNANYTHAGDKSVLQADAQYCKKSIANYLAKYVSKSQQQYESNHWKECKPSRYWGVSRPLNAILKQMTTTQEVSLGSRHEWEASYEDCLSAMTAWAKKSYSYGDKYQNAKVVVGYANPGELSWLSMKVSASIMKMEQPLSRSQSVEDQLYSRIARAVQCDVKLRELVLEFSDNKFLSWVEQPEVSGLSSLQVKTLVILDYRWYMSKMKLRYPWLVGRHSQLMTAIEDWYSSSLGQSTTPTEKPVKTELKLDVSDIQRNLQLTIWDKVG